MKIRPVIIAALAFAGAYALILLVMSLAGWIGVLEQTLAVLVAAAIGFLAYRRAAM